ncbi:hypothetical protein MIF8_61 [Erwinia phage MIF8]
MGFFSKKKTYRDFSFQRVIEDKYLPDVMGQAITKYVLDTDNTKSLTDLMLDYGWESNAFKWNAAYRYAIKPGKYTYGAPAVSIASQTDYTGAESLDDVLKNLTGSSSINYLYSKFTGINFRHAMWQIVTSNFGYVPNTNELTGLSSQIGTPVYLHNSTNYLTGDTRRYSNTNNLAHWGVTPLSGYTPSRAADSTRPDTADKESATGGNYFNLEYTFQIAGVKDITTVSTTTTTTTVSTPKSGGGYTDVTTTSSSDSTSSYTDYAGKKMPANITSTVKTNQVTSNSSTTGTPSTTTSTDSKTGVITKVTKQTNTKTTTVTYTGTYIAAVQMGFGRYDYTPTFDTVDTTTVLDDRDSGNYDPNAPLKPSGESTSADGDWFQVFYSFTSGSTTRQAYFTYAFGSGDYPALDGIKDTTVADFGKHFPRIYFRLNGDKLIDDKYKDTGAYKTSVNMANKLGMSWQGIGEEIYSSLSSLDKVRDVGIIQCIPAYTSAPIEIEYLHRYFKTLYNLRKPLNQNNYPPITVTQNTGSSVRPETDYDTYAAHVGAVVLSNDTVTSFTSECDALGYKLFNGVIGVTGFVSTSKGTAQKLVIYNRNYYDSAGSGNFGQWRTEVTYGTEDIQYVAYRKQISATQYEEVRVYGLSTSMRVGGAYVNKTDEASVMVPLDYAFRKEYSPHEAETLYARATYLFIGTEYTVKTKWYQTGLFNAVIVVAAVAISWATGGISLSAIGVITAAASAVGAMVIFSLLSKYVFSQLGGWFAYLALVIAVAAVAYGGYLAISGTTGPFSITATQMIQVSNSAFKAASSNVQGQMEKYQSKLDDLNQEIEAKTASLKEAQDELDPGFNTITNGIFTSVDAGHIVIGETPQGMLQRTLNTNVGVVALDLAKIYIEGTTRPPSTVEIVQQMLQNSFKPSEIDLTLDS